MLGLLAEGWVVAVLFSLLITMVITGVVACIAVLVVGISTRRWTSTL